MISEPPDFADFRALSAALGEDPLMAQGAGGNTSIKHGGAMWIKASGTWLKHAVSKNIFVTVKLPFPQGEIPVAAGAPKPSIETPLHAALPHRIVVHVHAVQVLALAVRRDAEELCEKKLSRLKFTFIPYAMPGLPLTHALRDSLQPPVSDIFILGNHGLIVAAETVADIKLHLAEIGARLDTPARMAPEPDIKFLEQASGKSGWRLPVNKAVHSLATDPVSRAYATGGTLYPDHVVFLGRGCRAIAADKLVTIDPAKQPMILIEGKGVLLAASLSPAGEAMAECLAGVLSRIPPEVDLNYLGADEEDELLNWDAEKYRQTLTS